MGKKQPELNVGDRAKFFHPGTLGVMTYGKVLKVGKFSYHVEFDDPYPGSRKRRFWTFKEYNQ
jgi:hypothetical protein